jgi:hypothetical protein
MSNDERDSAEERYNRDLMREEGPETPADKALARVAEAIEAAAGCDIGDAEWLAGRAFRTLTRMRRESLNLPADEPDDPDEDDPAAWIALHYLEGSDDRLWDRASQAAHARHGGCYVGCRHDPGRLHPGEDNNPRTGFAYND